MDCVAISGAHEDPEGFVGPCGMCRLVVVTPLLGHLFSGAPQFFPTESTINNCNCIRQTLAEFNPHIPIYLVRPDGMVKITNLNVQLPEAFSPKNVKLKFYNGNSE